MGSHGVGHAAKGDIMRICIALERYFSELRALPPDTGYGLDMERSPGTYDPGALWRYLTKRVYDKRTGRWYGPYLEWQERHMKPYTDARHGESYYLIDTWGNPYAYTGDPRRVIRNPGSFDVFSAGPDGVTACDNGRDDDGDGMKDCSRNPMSRAPKDNRAYNGLDDDGDGVIDDKDELGPEAVLNGEVGDDINNWCNERP